jgi:diguanylate cyclase (GGDEF)-like protein
MDRRAAVAVALGLTAALLATAAALTGAAWLAAVAGVIGALSAVAIKDLAGRLRRAEHSRDAALTTVGTRQTTAESADRGVADRGVAGADVAVAAEGLDTIGNAAAGVVRPSEATVEDHRVVARTVSAARELHAVVAPPTAERGRGQQWSGGGNRFGGLQRSATHAPGSLPASTVFDTDSGLLDERVFVIFFERKVSAARRHLRPLSLVLIDVGDGLPVEPAARSQALASFGEVARNTLRESDIACRIGETTFGLILEDTTQGGAVWAAERLQIASSEAGPPLRLSAAVATYPNHGLEAPELLVRANQALAIARCKEDSRGLGAVEVANAPAGSEPH